MSASKPLILEGSRVYVVEPFPLKEAHRIYSWMKAFKTVIQSDYSPKTKKEFVEEFKLVSPNVRSFAVIDKNNQLDNDPIEIVGAIIFEPQGKTNGFLHAASRISAFGSRMLDEAGEIVIKELFDSNPELLRLSAVFYYKNNMAQSLCKRLGFSREGRIEDMIVQKGEPKPVLWFGLTRKAWKEKQLWLESSKQEQLVGSSFQSLDSSEPSSHSLEDSLDQPLEALESKVDKVQPELSTEPDRQPDSELTAVGMS